MTGEEVAWSAWGHRIGRLRVEAWTRRGLCGPQTFPDGVWVDPVDAVAHHLVWRSGDALLASVRYSIWPRWQDCPHAADLTRFDIDVRGPIGLPERAAVRPGVHAVTLPQITAAVRARLTKAGVRCALTEASPPSAKVLVGPDRRVLGPAAPDPRFPQVRFVWVLSQW